MIKRNRFFATSIVALCGVCVCGARAAQNAPTVMSKYGEIQSVNKYSSNPFWTPNSPYNQRFPTPIYATGADLTTGDCNRIVQNLVTEYCANRNYCSNSRISDVRPVVMVQLSQLPGHNFATSCGGYIDSVFEDYKKTYGNSSTNNIIKPVQRTQPTIQIDNPFAQTKTDYEKLVDERTAELERLQNITTPTATVTAANFPKTIDDLSFTDRLANTTAGYEPYKNLNAYKTPNFETEDQYYERMKSVLEHDIHYIGAGAANTSCPTKYLTGRGATVSCTPTRQNGTCTAWCTDAAKTNCPTAHTISPNDRDDKTFYAKCTCNAGYQEQNNKCVRPGTPGGGNNNGGNNNGGGIGPNPNTNTCTDPAYMDANCACTVVPNTHEESGKCVCDNGKNIANYCDDDEERFVVWYCLAKNTAAVRLIHKDGNSALSKWSKMCRTNKNGIDNCIGSYSYPNMGIINRLFKEQVRSDILYGYSNGGELLASDRSSGWPERLELSKADVEKFIKAITDNISNISSECDSSHGRDWWLFIDKLPSSGYKGDGDLKPYKAICIGGDASDNTSCTPGTIETY
ncbi:MAG: hypothetical protein J5620_00350 [Alphaproteobacteria bacterium]|nr:hypothetical protein [Alphaproteobacteria bacterium]